MLLLLNVFEKFISTCLKYYDLDPCHYFSSPGLSWDTMLKMTKLELEKISNSNMPLFIERCIRWGICCVSKRGFKWVKVNNETINRVLNKSINSLRGYFLEVDLEIPEELHDEHNHLPMAPEKIKVTEEMLSPIQLEIKKNILK